jgi:hypothetical protein
VEFDLKRAGAIVALAESTADQSTARIDVRPRMASVDERLEIRARTFAEGRDDRRIEAAQWHISLGLWRRGPSAIVKRYTGPPLPDDPDEAKLLLMAYSVQRQDVEDAVNQMLGRDPEQQRLPRRGWGSLAKSLRAESIEISEDDLLAAPFVFEFSDELLGELGPDS